MAESAVSRSAPCCLSRRRTVSPAVERAPVRTLATNSSPDCHFGTSDRSEGAVLGDLADPVVIRVGDIIERGVCRVTSPSENVPQPTSRPPRSQFFPWYDSTWLSRYHAAKQVIQKVRPGALDKFTEAFRVFHTRPDFKVRIVERVFDDEQLTEIRRTVASLRPTDLELHEARRFGRFVVHDHPFRLIIR